MTRQEIMERARGWYHGHAAIRAWHGAEIAANHWLQTARRFGWKEDERLAMLALARSLTMQANGGREVAL